ncbi:hypothetical protein KKG41_02960 [Patescibacteria group bacterium]|nr:hypothetical protein [Patescibacteria group bacterium]MBU1891046.1 hypothetical protein [Patescibacteria group bacterium]
MNNDYLLQQKALVEELESSFARGDSKTTVVETQKDYANDDQICLTSIVFIPDEISSKVIQNISDPLKKIEPQQYFYPPGSMHLTIKNIRTISKPPLFTQKDVIKVNELFNIIIPKFSVIEFRVEDVLLFPTSISLMAYSNDDLQKLVLALDKGLNEIDLPDDKTLLSDSIFWGNITVCRFTEKPNENFVSKVKKMRNMKIGKLKVEKISLVTCNAVCHPGSRKVISEYELKQG